MTTTAHFRFKSLLAFALFFLFQGLTIAQSQFMSEANSNGFFLKKVVSDTTIQSGQTFSYTLYFSIPAGATNVTITDALPTGLQYQGYSVSAVCGTMNVLSTPTVGAGGTLQLGFPSVVTGCSGSISITVNFPTGTTCNGTGVRNRVCMAGTLNGATVDLCTGFVSTTATAINPWQISKYVIGAAYQGGTCPNVTLDSIITYRICVSKMYGTNGQLNLVNGSVTDVLPTGAVLVGSSCVGAVTQTGNTITWAVGSLGVTPPYNQQCCDIQVKYPRALFPIGSQITNSATLTGGLGSTQPTCGNFTQNSNSTCVEIKGYVQGSFAKYAYTTGQPGCGGYYWIQFCNTGTLPINGLTITDNLPAGLTGYTTSNGAGVTSSITGGVMTATYTGTLNPGACAYVQVNFTIPAGATVGSTINNCANATYTGLATPIQSCAPFVVTAPLAQACIWKDVCNKQASYTAGQTFRYRLRVQNIGGQAITGASITDILNGNLQYVGNPTYYTTTNWASPCSTPALPAGATALTGVTFSQSGQTLTWNLPTIGASCQSLFYQYCSNYGNFSVPYNYIEFDVKIKDTACIGNIPNYFAISGGNVTAQNSNVEYVNVVGTAAFNLDKTVSKDNGATYAASATAAAGSNVQFKLKFTPSVSSTTAMRHVTYVDLMPRDNTTGDLHILNRSANRGSQYDLNFQNSISSTPTAVGGYDMINVANAKINGIIIPAVTGLMFPYTGGTGVPNWTSPIINTPVPVSSKNLTAYFGGTPITTSAEAVFAAQIPTGTAAQLTSCNTFAANAATCHLINSALMVNMAMAPQESVKACVDATPSVFSCCDSIQVIPQPQPKCCFQIKYKSNNCDLTSVNVSMVNGTIGSVTFNAATTACFNNPSPAIGLSAYTFTPIGSACGVFTAQICPTATPGTTVIINYQFNFANGQKCLKSDTLRQCDAVPTDCCKSVEVISINTPNQCCSKIKASCPIKNVQVSITNGVLGDISFTGANAACFTPITGSSLTTTNFAPTCSPNTGIEMTVCPKPSANPTIITYVITFADGTNCTKLDTLNCLDPIKCCEGIKITPITTNGQCCSQITTVCPVRSVQVNITGGVLGNVTFAGTSASLYTNLTGSSLTTNTFNASAVPATGLDMTVCPKPSSNPTIIHYVVTFVNGEKCERYDTLNCIQVKCCDGIKVTPTVNPATGQCCSQITANCPITSLQVNLTGGTISSAAFASPCTINTAPSIGLASYLFSGSCTNLDFKLCAKATSTTGQVIINYIVTFANGEKCERADTLNCPPPQVDCCKGTEVISFDTNGQCCSQIKAPATCKIKVVQVTVINGQVGDVTFGGVNASCYTNIVGSTATSVLIAPTCAGGAVLDMKICPKPTATPVIIKYSISFTDGTVCEKADTLDCKPPTDSCIIAACYAYSATGLAVNFNATGTTSNQPIVMYVWSFGDGTYGTSTTPTISHNYTTSGTYKVCMTVHTLYKGTICDCIKTICKDIKIAQGATSSSTCTSNLTNPSVSTEVGQLKASPNPSRDNFHITLSKMESVLENGKAEIKVFNVQGTLLFTKTIDTTINEFDIQAESYPAGLYVVALQKDGEVISSIKVIKQ